MDNKKLIDLSKLEDLIKKSIEENSRDPYVSNMDNLHEIVESQLENSDRSILEDALIMHASRSVLNIPRADTMFDYSPLHAQAAKFGLSLSAVCAAAGISNSVRKLINSGEAIHMNHLYKIALLLECEVHELFKQIPSDEYTRMMFKGNKISSNSKLYAFILDQLVSQSSEGEEETERVLSASSIKLADEFDNLNTIRKVLKMEKFDYDKSRKK